ncbi:hypothetical protein ALC57_13069, partial [Trachymyrmex cornetzi]
LKNKDREFWKGLRKWDVIVLSETWMEKKGWEKVKKSFPRGFIWKMQWAVREKKKGRAMGDMIMRIRKELLKRGEEIKSEEEGVIEGRVTIGEKKWRIIGVYVKSNLERYRGSLEKWMEEKKVGEKVIIGGDFNARTGREGEAKRREEDCGSGEEKNRRSKDGKVNKEGRKLVEMRDEEGEFTFTGGMGSTVINYAVGDEETKERIKKMRIGEIKRTRMEIRAPPAGNMGGGKGEGI